MAVTKVIILNWNGEKMLSQFLPSVLKNTPPEIEVVVADNGSTDSSVAVLERDFPSVRLIRLDRNWGFAQGYNRAIEQLEGDYFVLLNSDVETPAGWLEPLVQILDNQSDVAAVAPKVLSLADRTKFEYAGAAGGFIDSLGYPFCRGRILGSVETDRGQYDDAREVFWATGACFACRADVFRALGGFDGTFFAHQEEIDLCWRMQLAGWRVMVEPRSVVYHLGGGTLAPSPQKIYLNYRNNLAMLRKNLPSSRAFKKILFFRSIFDFFLVMAYFLGGQWQKSAKILQAYRDFRGVGEKKVQKNGDFAKKTKKSSKIFGIFHGSIFLRYLFCRKFPDI